MARNITLDKKKNESERKYKMNCGCNVLRNISWRNSV